MKVYTGESLKDIQIPVMRELLKSQSANRREMDTLEIHPVVFELLDPTKRVFMTPYRNNNMYAQVAETLWVLAGRVDMQFLTHYLPRAAEYSDDGETWGAGYGQRLRKWNGITRNAQLVTVDQVKSVQELLKADTNTRRATIQIFDPAKDHDIKSKDVACNNWLHFLVHDGKLDMEVASRSMDFLWGSNINFFEWTVLQEILAYSLGIPVGKFYFFVSSCHMYKKFHNRFQHIVDSATDFNIYDHTAPLEFDLKTKSFQEVFNIIDEILRLESCCRHTVDNTEMAASAVDEHESDWLSTWTRILFSFLHLREDNPMQAARILFDAQPCDLVYSCVEYILRVGCKYDRDARKAIIDMFSLHFDKELMRHLKEY